MTDHHPTVIVGAGLSGLYIAWRLHSRQREVVVLEARERCGGRIVSPNPGTQPDSCIDLGPAWLWPQLQPRLKQLVTDLKITLFRQYTTGDIQYEIDPRSIERYRAQSSHNQSYRIVGGCQRLIDNLAARLPESIIHLNTRVTSIDQSAMCIQAVRDGQLCEFAADKIILALPPRISQQDIDFSPPLADEISRLWSSIPTWMAGHSKLVFIYDQPFWRDQGLSGEVFSRCGPLTEIYDGSPANEEYYALTSFVGLNAHQRRQITPEQLINSCLAQLQRLFGAESLSVKDVRSKDWSTDRYTATEGDLSSAAHHPQYPANMPRAIWDERLILAGTEVAREYGGYLEGALESADEALSLF